MKNEWKNLKKVGQTYILLLPNIHGKIDGKCCSSGFSWRGNNAKAPCEV
jgi:hypothetical protein